MPADTKTEQLKTAFDYLYKTYFGQSQIEKDEIERLPALLKDCRMFIDVGASLGMYTYFANKILKDADIVAIEADPDRFPELKKNCAKWEKDSNNRIKAIHAIAGDSREPKTFFKTGTHISGGIFTIAERSDHYERVQLPQVILDDYYQDVNTTIKIDVEGAEYRVLSGALKYLKRVGTKFIIGIHSWGDRERGKMPMHVLWLLYSKKLNIKKSTNRLTANYIFEQNDRPASALRLSYIRYAPLLFARQVYRNYLPRTFIRWFERKLNELRKKEIDHN